MATEGSPPMQMGSGALVEAGTESRRGRWQHPLPDGRVQCDLCPRHCRLRDEQRGFCFVRRRKGAEIELQAYGRPSSIGIDPIEKKPLYHFLPGSRVLSLGTAGCNLACKFCQNWKLSRSRDPSGCAEPIGPEGVAEAAVLEDCASVAFTYNDPIVFAEYALDTARASRIRTRKTVAVTAGYISPSARKEFFQEMDAVNVDLKSFSPDFYRKLCSADLQPVLDTLIYLAQETQVWLEVTTLLIPDLNDSEGEVDALCRWIAAELGRDVPLHFSAFHPDYRLIDRGRTPAATCQRARKQAQSLGLRYVYTGNVRDPAGQSTFCPKCGKSVIERDGYRVKSHLVQGAHCPGCATKIAGLFS